MHVMRGGSRIKNLFFCVSHALDATHTTVARSSANATTIDCGAPPTRAPAETLHRHKERRTVIQSHTRFRSDPPPHTPHHPREALRLQLARCALSPLRRPPPRSTSPLRRCRPYRRHAARPPPRPPPPGPLPSSWRSRRIHESTDWWKASLAALAAAFIARFAARSASEDTRGHERSIGRERAWLRRILAGRGMARAVGGGRAVNAASERAPLSRLLPSADRVFAVQ